MQCLYDTWYNASKKVAGCTVPWVKNQDSICGKKDGTKAMIAAYNAFIGKLIFKSELSTFDVSVGVAVLVQGGSENMQYGQNS